MSARGRLIVAALAAGVGALGGAGGCGGGGDGAPRAPRLEPPADVEARVTEHGQVRASVRVWPGEPRLGDPIYLRLTLERSPGAPEVTAPFSDEALGRLRVVGWTPSRQRRDDGTVVEEQTYTLEAPGSGKFRVPPLRVRVGDDEVLTEEVPITVAPVDPARAGEALAGPRPALSARAAVRAVPLHLIVPLAVAGALALGGLGLMTWRRRRARQVRVSAFDEAMRRLAALAARGAPDAGAADAWFVELSGIVRAYVEGRFGVRAPELTTEEFLQEARRAAGLATAHRDHLTGFLARCDRVKFAGYRPDAGESLETLAVARTFVTDTRPQAEVAGGGNGGRRP